MEFANRLLKAGAVQGLFLLVLATPLSADIFFPNSENCLQRAREQQGSSINLQIDCPRLFAGLKEKNLLTTIEPPIAEEITVLQLTALNSMLQQRDDIWALDSQGLEGLLAEIRIQVKKKPSEEWWNRFLAWLKSLKPEQYEVEFKWLVDILNALLPSEQMIKLFTTVMIYSLIAISLGIIVWEFYLTGAFSRFGFRRRANATGHPVPTVTVRSSLGLQEISRLAPVAQVAALLNYVIARLTEQKQLPEDPSLTNLELTHYLQQQDAPKKTAFSQLVRQSEPVLYGNKQPCAAILRKCWQNAELICSD